MNEDIIKRFGLKQTFSWSDVYTFEKFPNISVIESENEDIGIIYTCIDKRGKEIVFTEIAMNEPEMVYMLIQSKLQTA